MTFHFTYKVRLSKVIILLTSTLNFMKAVQGLGPRALGRAQSDLWAGPSAHVHPRVYLLAGPSRYKWRHTFVISAPNSFTQLRIICIPVSLLAPASRLCTPSPRPALRHTALSPRPPPPFNPPFLCVER